MRDCDRKYLEGIGLRVDVTAAEDNDVVPVEWIQVDNGGTWPGNLRILYQGAGGDRFGAWFHGFGTGMDFASDRK